MASWLGGGGKGGAASAHAPRAPPTNQKSVLSTNQKPKKRERWLITRKTWRYMADAGKLLIPESLRKGTEEDLKFYEEQYQDACDRQQEFVIWEGPLEDPRHALAKSRQAPSLSSESQEPSEDSDYRFESHSAKFRIVLPPGSKPPPGYVQVGKRSVPVGDIPQSAPESYLRLPSGLVVQELSPRLLQDVDWLSCSDITSPLDSGIISSEELLMSPREGSPDFDFKVDTRESGIGSGADSAVTVYTNRRNVSCQTEPLPPEFHHLLQGELKALEELKAKEDEAARIAQESEALAKREARRSSEDYDAAAMGDTVMRYLKMVRRNSKSVDQKKAERFRSMNYDPTLRNIKSKYVHNAGSLDCVQHVGTQCGDSLINILKMCHTPIEPSRKKTDRRKEALN